MLNTLNAKSINHTMRGLFDQPQRPRFFFWDRNPIFYHCATAPCVFARIRKNKTFSLKIKTYIDRQ